MPDPKTPRAPRGSKPLTCGQALDLAEQLRAKAIERAAALDDRHKAEVDDLHARQMRELADVETELGAALEKTIARVPQEQRDRARELCGVPDPVEKLDRMLEDEYGKDPDGIVDAPAPDEYGVFESILEEAADAGILERVDEIPPALLTEPEPVTVTVIDREAGTTKRKTLGGGR